MLEWRNFSVELLPLPEINGVFPALVSEVFPALVSALASTAYSLPSSLRSPLPCPRLVSTAYSLPSSHSYSSSLVRLFPALVSDVRLISFCEIVR